MSVIALPDGPAPGPVAGASELQEPPAGLNETERQGLAALRMRESDDYRAIKRNRPRAGAQWDMPSCTTVVPTPMAATHVGAPASAGPTSEYLEGSVAVGIIIVQGPGDALKFSDAERTQVVAEVQNGLGWLATQIRPPESASRTTSRLSR